MRGYKKLLCVFLTVLTAFGLFVGAMATVGAETADTEGMSFNQEDIYYMKSAINNELLTFEAEIWVPNLGEKRSGTVLGNYRDGGGGNRLGLEIRDGGIVQLYTASTRNELRLSNVSLYDYCADGSYVHIAVAVERVADGTDKTHFYINGEWKGTVEVEIPAGILGSSLIHAVGGDAREANAQYFKGKIKNVAAFYDTRTAAEIAADAASADSAVVSSTDDLAVCYDLTSAKFFDDMSSNGNDLAMSSSKGLAFVTGTDSSKMVAKPVPPRTMEATIFVPTHVTGRAGVVFGNYDGVAKNGQFNLEIYNNGAVRLYYNDTAGNTKSCVFSTATSVLTGSWVHVTVVHTGTAIKCYINGEHIETISGVKDYQSSVPGQVLCIGGDNRANNGSAFKGKIKNLTLYSDVRTDAEILSDYQNGTKLTSDGLIAYYDLEDAENDDFVEDLTGNGYDFSRTWLSSSGIDLSPYSYSFAVVGDTQMLVEYDVDNGLTGDNSRLGKIYSWIAANKELKKIKYVMGLGDITQTDTDAEWEHAVTQISRLEAAGLDYSLVCGNYHDSAAQYNAFVVNGGKLSYTDQVMGCYKAGDYTNTWNKFTVGDVKYMLFVLGFGANDDILNWAGELIAANPDHRVIITTHCYLFRDGTTLDKGDVAPPDSTGQKAANNGDEMWDKLIRKHANIFLVLSGHDPYADIVMTQTKGDNGNTVTQFLIDPQGIDAKYSYNTGLLALLHFTEDGREVAVEYVSGVTGKYFKVDNQFEFELISNEGRGVLRTEFVSRVGNMDTYRIFYTNGTYTEYTIGNGLNVTVTGVTKTTNGLVDTYTIAFSDGTSTEFTVNNGQDGQDGANGADGKAPYIGENGNWWIGLVDTGITADKYADVEKDHGITLDSGSCGEDAEWRVTDKNVLIISGKGAIKDYTSTAVAPWILYKEDITSIVIEEGIVGIGNNAFNGMEKVKSVELPTTLTTIGKYAFYSCKRLDGITVPAKVRYIGQYAFRKSGIDEAVFRVAENWTVDGAAAPDHFALAGVMAQNITSRYYKQAWERGVSEDGGVIASGYCGESVIWMLSDNGTLTVRGEGDMDFVRAPWKKYMTVIYKVVVDEGVTSVKDDAFSGAYRLKETVLPEIG